MKTVELVTGSFNTDVPLPHISFSLTSYFILTHWRCFAAMCWTPRILNGRSSFLVCHQQYGWAKVNDSAKKCKLLSCRTESMELFNAWAESPFRWPNPLNAPRCICMCAIEWKQSQQSSIDFLSFVLLTLRAIQYYGSTIFSILAQNNSFHSLLGNRHFRYSDFTPNKQIQLTVAIAVSVNPRIEFIYISVAFDIRCMETPRTSLLLQTQTTSSHSGI